MQTHIYELLSIYNENLYVEKLPIPLDYEGQFLKKTMVFALDSCNNEQNKTLLFKMLDACKLSNDDVALMWLPVNSDLPQIVQHYQPQHFISFGIPIQNDLIQMPNNCYVVNHLAHFPYILSHSLTELLPNTTFKKNIWTALKEMYQL
jgi:hypothetical protein